MVAEAFIDESEVLAGGRRLLIYAVVLPHNGQDALSKLLTVKEVHGIGTDTEIKWRLAIADPLLKSRVKNDALDIVARECTGLISVNSGLEKDQAFLATLQQIRAHCGEVGVRRIGLHYDEGCFKDARLVRTELGAWGKDGIVCSSLARHDSRFSLGIQLADILAGTFGYMISCALRTAGPPPPVVPFGEKEGSHDDIPLPDFFQIMLRWSIPGKGRSIPEEGPIEPEHLMKECLGSGVILNGDFSAAERKLLAHLATFYMGCMH